MAPPVLLILGAGPNIGQHVAKAFATKGYKIALASRSAKAQVDDQLHIPVDLAKPETVASVFDTVKEKFDAFPSVVVYNGAKHIVENKADPLASLKLQDVQDVYSINTTSSLVAAQAAVRGFQTLDSSASKTFIFTGNILNLLTVPGLTVFGASKGATAYTIKGLVENTGYGKEGISFYYADERAANGGAVYSEIDGPGAAEEYLKLAERNDQGPWLYTFVKHQGYKDFGQEPKL